MFSRDEREQIRAALVRAAQADSDVTGAAYLGSAAADRLDDWSDIDLALCVSHDAALDDVIAAWTARMYRDHEAIAHCDVRRGETLYRVFLLRNTLQVRSEEHTSELQSRGHLVCRLLLEKKKKNNKKTTYNPIKSTKHNSN